MLVDTLFVRSVRSDVEIVLSRSILAFVGVGFCHLWRFRHHILFQSHVVQNNDQEQGLDIGELGQITVQNDEAAAASAAMGAPFRKTWTAKYTLRSHFDSVRALCFHPVEPVLITGKFACL